MEAISSDPAVDKAELAAGGLSAAQIDAIESAVKSGVARQLEVSVGLALNALGTSEAAFLYEVDLDVLDAAGRLAVNVALDGDLGALTRREPQMPAGIRLIRSILTETSRRSRTLKVNLLGIYNFVSISTLILKGTVLFEPESGELIITDQVTASRIKASSLPFAADQEKLRRVLAESFLVTAAYRSSRFVATAPEIKAAHSYFELHTRTKRQTMKDNLDIAEALGIMTREEKRGLLGATTDFGRTTFYAETGYNDRAAQAAFLRDGAARAAREYEQAGRQAFAQLLRPGDPDEYRRQPMIDDPLWAEMRRRGQPTIPLIDAFRSLEEVQRQVIVSDYSVIVWWSEAMHETGERLAEIHEFLRLNPDADIEDNEFRALRRRLAQKLKDVARQTKHHFGEPWGVVAMDIVSGGAPEAKVRVTGPVTAFERAR